MSAGPNDDATEHPHRGVARIPVRLSVGRLRELSRIEPGRALRAVFVDWLIIVSAIAIAHFVAHPIVTALAVVCIGARQHSLTVISHDAAHFRFLNNHRLNDWLADLLAAWPVFLSVFAFRYIHGQHHRFVGQAGDGNRRGWRTHTADGQLRPEWTYPKSRLGLIATLLRRAALLTGIMWIVRGLIAPFFLRRPVVELLARTAYYVLAAVALTMLDWWPAFMLMWILPYCTWHMVAQYARLICEHSGRIGTQPGFELTRTTIPTPLGRFLVLPRNIGYHLEHHWYPSVPWYNLPQLHEALREDPDFRAHANISSSVLGSLRQCSV
jgi:fatty acid desaturase